MQLRGLFLLSILRGACSFLASPRGISRKPFHAPQAVEDDSSVMLAPIENMKAQELKAELNLRKVSFVGCYDKTDLQNLLRDSRVSGRCDPEVIERFNRQMAERMSGSEDSPDLNKIDLDAIKAGDGSLPGGLSPTALQSLAGNPKVMAALSNPKLQALMKAMMTDGPDATLGLIKDDPESEELLEMLQGAMARAMEKVGGPGDWVTDAEKKNTD
mmetsp:Transcript_25804/g.43999  ORF Transcript_25804/g.43999 Transcript_25804/m.43999 type:complete len:215 (-) Transcript_25804:141-785(-)